MQGGNEIWSQVVIWDHFIKPSVKWLETWNWPFLTGSLKMHVDGLNMATTSVEEKVNLPDLCRGTGSSHLEQRGLISLCSDPWGKVLFIPVAADTLWQGV